jgi:hypothetical protein
MPARNQQCRQTASGRSKATALYGELDQAAFFAAMIDAERLVIRLRVRRLYGVLMEKPPGS